VTLPWIRNETSGFNKQLPEASLLKPVQLITLGLGEDNDLSRILENSAQNIGSGN
jgi:hypothetical protein